MWCDFIKRVNGTKKIKKTFRTKPVTLVKKLSIFYAFIAITQKNSTFIENV